MRSRVEAMFKLGVWLVKLLKNVRGSIGLGDAMESPQLLTEALRKYIGGSKSHLTSRLRRSYPILTREYLSIATIRRQPFFRGDRWHED